MVPADNLNNYNCGIIGQRRFYLFHNFIHKMKQECIPVGCVPPAAVAIFCVGVSASVHAGIHPPGTGPGDPLGVGPVTPPGVGLETSPPARSPNLPLGVGLETPPGCGPRHPP